MSLEDASRRFLVVDDNEDIRDVLVRMIERLGHSASIAADGVEAVEVLAEERFDYMLLDLAMPRMGGVEVLRWLEGHPDRGEGLCVVVVSAWVGEQRAHLQELGVHVLWPKPFRVQHLRDLLSGTRPGRTW